MLSYRRLLQEKAKGSRAQLTSARGPASEHALVRYVSGYLGYRGKGMSHNDALYTTMSGTEGSKGTNVRSRFGAMVRKLKSGKGGETERLASALGRTEHYSVMKDMKFAAHAIADHYNTSGATFTSVQHLGADNSGAAAEKAVGGKTKADVSMGLSNNRRANISLKYEDPTVTSSKSNTFKLSNPGGAVLPKAVDAAHAKAFRDKNGNDKRTGRLYQSPNVSGAFENSQSSRLDIGNKILQKPEHAAFLGQVFGDKKNPVTYTKGSGSAAAYNPKGGGKGKPILNSSAMAYIRRISEGDRKAIPEGHPHSHPEVMEKAKNLYKEYEGAKAVPAAEVTSKMAGAMKEIMTGHVSTWGSHQNAREYSQTHREAAHDVMRAVFGVPKDAAPTMQVTVVRHKNKDTGRQVEPTVKIHDLNKAVSRHISSTPAEGYNFEHTPGTSTIRINGHSVGYDRGSWNVQVRKDMLGEPDAIYSRNWKPKKASKPAGRK